MSKFTDAVKTALKAYFETGDQPTAAQFAAFIDAVQEGIEEHDHNALGDGDAANVAAAGITNRTRKVFIPALSGYYSPVYNHHGSKGVAMQSAVETSVWGKWRIPEDFVSGLTVKAIVHGDSTGNMRLSGEIQYGGVGESYYTHSNTYSENTIAIIGAGVLYEVASIAIASAAKGDYLKLQLQVVPFRRTRNGD